MAERIPLAAVLAGGAARRMGRDKTGIDIGGIPLLERVWRAAARACERVVVVGGPPRLDHLGVPTVADRYPGANSMGGIATALEYAGGPTVGVEWVLCLACDMPFLVPELLLLLWARRPGADIVVPRIEVGYEPLCALYRVACLPAFEREIREGNLSIRSIYPRVRTREVPESELRRIDPGLRSFVNVNRPSDLLELNRVPPAAQGQG